MVDGWARWDTAHDVAVAFFGYGDPASPSHDGGLGFFPIYPKLMRGAARLASGPITDGQLATAAVLISNVAFLLLIVACTVTVSFLTMLFSHGFWES